MKNIYRLCFLVLGLSAMSYAAQAQIAGFNPPSPDKGVLTAPPVVQAPSSDKSSQTQTATPDQQQGITTTPAPTTNSGN